MVLWLYCLIEAGYGSTRKSKERSPLATIQTSVFHSVALFFWLKFKVLKERSEGRSTTRD